MPSANIESSSRKPFRRDLIVVGLLAVALRLAIALAVPPSAPFSDMAEYHVRAELLLNEGRFYPDSWRGPGFPLLLAGVYSLPGPDWLAIRIANAVLGGLTAMLTCMLASALVGRAAAVAAGAIVAVYPGLVLSSIYVMPQGLYACLTMTALVIATGQGHARGVAAGVLTGCAILTRSLGVALIPAIGLARTHDVWRAWPWRRICLRSAPLVLACGVTLLPWLWQTTRVSGAPMLDSAAAYNVLVGNNPRATGRLEIANGNWVMANYLGEPMSEAERNRAALDQSWEWIRHHPLAWLRLVPIKIGNLWGLEGREHAWLYSVSYFGARAAGTVWTWGGLLLVSFPLLALAATVGTIREGLLRSAVGVQIAVLLAVVTLLHVISFGESRFHLPLIPVLAVLAVRGAALEGGITRARAVIGAVIVATLIAAWINQAPELLADLNQLARPDGWRSWAEY